MAKRTKKLTSEESKPVTVDAVAEPVAEVKQPLTKEIEVTDIVFTENPSRLNRLFGLLSGHVWMKRKVTVEVDEQGNIIKK